MQANKAVRAFGGRSYFGDGNRGSIAGKDGVFFYDRIQRRKCFLLLFNVLDDGFDDNVTVCKRLSAGRSLEPTTDCLHRLLQVAFFGKLGQRLLDSCKAFMLLLQPCTGSALAAFTRALRNKTRSNSIHISLYLLPLRPLRPLRLKGFGCGSTTLW